MFNLDPNTVMWIVAVVLGVYGGVATGRHFAYSTALWLYQRDRIKIEELEHTTGVLTAGYTGLMSIIMGAVTIGLFTMVGHIVRM